MSQSISPGRESVPSLTVAQCEAFARSLFMFHLEELNCLGDQLAYAETESDNELLTRAGERCRLILEALGWDEGALKFASEVASLAPELPEDLFAPLLMIASLAPERDPARSMLASASEVVRKRLELFSRSSSKSILMESNQ